MKSKFYFLLLFFIVIYSLDCFSQKKTKGTWKSLLNESSGDSTITAIRYEDFAYKPNIKTIQFHDESFELSQPILNLDAPERLLFSFDDLDADLKNYSYTIIHCNANWEPSDLVSAEYMEGFTDNPINDYKYSFNTLQKYTHYNLLFPGASTRILKSGNYILKVYDSNNPEETLITRRFMVYQNKVIIESRVTAATIIEDRNYKQELDFTINYTGYTITNPYDDLKIVITQNNRWDNAKKNLKPLFVKDVELVYDYDDVNVFNGGNEFRYFDIKSIRYQSERLYHISRDTAGNQIELVSDEKREYKRYSTNSDINGQFLIKIQEGQNSETDADYCYVHFFLPDEDAFLGGKLYVFGAFNGWKCNNENVMKYNAKRFGYECTLYLKQGYYNYEYVFVKDGEITADETMIEGNHRETENDYTIYVYHKQNGTVYDQLIGVKRLNSMKE